MTDVTRLRPNTVIQDEAIPGLLRAAREPTFVTINVSDFWRRVAADSRYCVACVAVPHTRVQEIPDHLRRLFSLEPFRTRRHRLGKVARVSRRQVQYYSVASPVVRQVDWSGPRA